MSPLLKLKESQMAPQACGLKVIMCRQVIVPMLDHSSTTLKKDIPEL